MQRAVGVPTVSAGGAVLSEDDVRLERLVARLREPLQSSLPAQPSQEQSACSASQVLFTSLLGTIWAVCCTSAGQLCTEYSLSHIAVILAEKSALWAGASHTFLRCAQCHAGMVAAAGGGAEAGGHGSGDAAGGAQRPPPRAEAQE